MQVIIRCEKDAYYRPIYRAYELVKGKLHDMNISGATSNEVYTYIRQNYVNASFSFR